MIKSAMKSGWGRLSIAVAGALIYALGINLFVAPLGLFTGGLMGLCQLLRSLILMVLGIDSLPFELAGVLLYAFNVPLLILAYRSMGKVFFRNTLICSTAYAVFASIVPVPPAPIVEDMLTGCLLGGVISGVGSGLALTSGCCGGGLDLLGLYLAKKGAKVTIGRFNLAFNAVLFITCGVLFDLTTLIYSVLNTIFNAMAIDRAHRQSVTVQVLIFTKEDRPELGRFIIEKLGRSVTYWEGTGAYSGKGLHVLVVCLSKFEIEDLLHAVHARDDHAFVTVQERVRVFGNFVRKLE